MVQLGQQIDFDPSAVAATVVPVTGMPGTNPAPAHNQELLKRTLSPHFPLPLNNQSISLRNSKVVKPPVTGTAQNPFQYWTIQSLKNIFNILYKTPLLCFSHTAATGRDTCRSFPSALLPCWIYLKAVTLDLIDSVLPRSPHKLGLLNLKVLKALAVLP